MDPHVLAVRTVKGSAACGGDRFAAFDLRRFCAHILTGAGCEHVLLDLEGMAVRLDVLQGSLREGAVFLCVELPLGPRLAARLDALQDFRAIAGRGTVRHKSMRTLEERFRALSAFDAWLAGASLRAIAEAQFGPGEWPGEGEHRKSSVRRLIGKGRAMVLAGPGAILV